MTFPLRDIETISDIPIKRNKRNGRPQATHVKIMSSTRDVLYPDGSWRNRNGRPVGSGTKESVIKEYVEKHPGATVTEIAKAVGVSRTTVYKYSAAVTAADPKYTEREPDHNDSYERMRKQKLQEYMKKLFEEDT